MTARNDIEEILEAQVWADRNAIFRPVQHEQTYTPISALREYEHREFRDEPAPPVYDELPFIPVGWVGGIVALAVLAIMALIYLFLA